MTTPVDTTPLEPVAPEPGHARSLLSTLPATTAWSGAAAVVLVPVASVVVAAIARNSPSDLQFLALLFPFMLIGALGTAAFGAVAGTLAGLPDWWLSRRRAPRLLGSVAAVAILTLVIGGGWGVTVTLIPFIVPLPVDVQVAGVAAATAVSTTVVVAVSRRRERRRASRAGYRVDESPVSPAAP